VLLEAKLSRFDHSPGRNELTANSVFELHFPLENQDTRGGTGHNLSERRPAQTAAHNNQVIIMDLHMLSHGGQMLLPQPVPVNCPIAPSWKEG
jgi:hypothetical protein